MMAFTVPASPRWRGLPVSSARCAWSRRTSSSPRRGTRSSSARALRYRRIRLLDEIETYRVNGTPADCVAIGAYRVGDVDVVLSGVNLGPNLGNATWHSGTLAAAKQATLLGMRGIALSAPVHDDEPDFADLEPWIHRVLAILLQDDRRARLVNVNLPLEPRGVRWTRMAVEAVRRRIVTAEDPMGRPIYWFTVVPLERHAEGTDLWAVERGFVSLTPLQLDLTDHEQLARGAEDKTRSDLAHVEQA